MEKGTFTIKLADGTQLTELELNGQNFHSTTEITPATFAGKLSRVIIKGDTEADEAGLIGEHRNMELVQIAHCTEKIHGCTDGWYFVLRDIPAAEQEKRQLRADVDFALMLGGASF